MTREETLNKILDRFPDALIVCSLGKMGRELFELRKKRGEPNDDFLIQGAMGSAIGVAIGVAMNTNKQVVCLIGDGALLMNLGSLVSARKPWNIDNLKIIVLNNECHASTGGQPTYFYLIRDKIKDWVEIIDVGAESRQDLGRPDISCEQITKNFREKLSK